MEVTDLVGKLSQKYFAGFYQKFTKLFSPRILGFMSQVTGAGTGGKALQLAEGRTHWPRTDLM